MEKKYVIGVDGGGTKTVAALANLEGKILNITRTGPSNPRNIGIKTALENIAKAIEENLKKIKKGKISAVFIGLAGFEEEYKFKKEKIRKILFKNKKIKPIFKGKVKIGSDQIVAFRSGTGRKEGILLIAGTGCVAHGWRAKKEFKISGWGWLADEGSAFWIGQRGYQALFKELDGRGPKTLITKLIFQEFKLKNQNDLMLKIYSLNTRAAAKGFEENFVLFSRLTFLSSGSA